MPTTPPIIYAPDIISSEVLAIVTSAVSGITLPQEPKKDSNGIVTETGTTAALVIIDGIVDPENSPRAPYCYIDITDGYAGDYAQIGADDLITVNIGLLIYTAIATDSKWLARVCHVIQRGLEGSPRFRDKMMKLQDNQIRLRWQKIHDIVFPFQAAVLEFTCRTPTPHDVAAANIPVVPAP